MAILMSGCAQTRMATATISEAVSGQKTVGTFKIGNPYTIAGKRYVPKESYTLNETGIASWYGPQFHGKLTANGEIFDMNELTAAHRTLQMPSLVRVTNLENGRSLIVRINDRGPFARGRIIDLSRKSADLLGFKQQGTAKVRVQVLGLESRQLAEAAKRGQDTSGTEIAMNNKGRLPTEIGHMDSALVRNTYQTARAASQAPGDFTPSAGSAGGLTPADRVPIQTAVAQDPLPALNEPVSRQELPVQTIPGHTKNGNFYPDPIIQEVPVVPTNIFVQAGSFSSPENAARYAARLDNAKVYPALVNGQQFYRVRIPAQTVEAADSVLAKLAAENNAQAIIIVE